jgi:hypothetical protein
MAGQKPNYPNYLLPGLPIREGNPSFSRITTPLLAECPFVLFCSNFNK